MKKDFVVKKAGNSLTLVRDRNSKELIAHFGTKLFAHFVVVHLLREAFV